ncbi:MAG TPA: ribosome-associated translation inhibitor RaiA [Thermomicrobiales bacterium]|nr:ribosome-associated translation inhibitor RaiA [Thermomicrobiales bacterium]
MEVQIKARDLKVSPSLHAFIVERTSKLDRFLDRVDEAKLELNHEHPRTGGERVKAQLTIARGRAILRAEEQNADVRRAVDLVVDKMCRRIQRYHGKRVDRKRGAPTEQEALAEQALAETAELDVNAGDEEADEWADGYQVVRTKRFPLKPMSSTEAIDQMELLGHDFYVFLNADDNQVNVLYRRKSGDYGLIQPV